jgi:hypothetical protein
VAPSFGAASAELNSPQPVDEDGRAAGIFRTRKQSSERASVAYSALAFCLNYELLLPRIKVDGEYVGLAANLAVLHILLQRTGGLVDGSRVSLSAIAALEVALHSK